VLPRPDVLVKTAPPSYRSGDVLAFVLFAALWSGSVSRPACLWRGIDSATASVPVCRALGRRIGCFFVAVAVDHGQNRNTIFVATDRTAGCGPVPVQPDKIFRSPFSKKSGCQHSTCAWSGGLHCVTLSRCRSQTLIRGMAAAHLQCVVVDS